MCAAGEKGNGSVGHLLPRGSPERLECVAGVAGEDGRREEDDAQGLPRRHHLHLRHRSLINLSLSLSLLLFNLLLLNLLSNLPCLLSAACSDSLIYTVLVWVCVIQLHFCLISSCLCVSVSRMHIYMARATSDIYFPLFLFLALLFLSCFISISWSKKKN